MSVDGLKGPGQSMIVAPCALENRRIRPVALVRPKKKRDHHVHQLAGNRVRRLPGTLQGCGQKSDQELRSAPPPRRRCQGPCEDQVLPGELQQQD
jgi:hypothetical protein